jgi:excinuclease UvrABC nuclease subunit
MIAEVENKMKKAAKDLDFITAAQFRDEMMSLRKTFREKFGGSDEGVKRLIYLNDGDTTSTHLYTLAARQTKKA